MVHFQKEKSNFEETKNNYKFGVVNFIKLQHTTISLIKRESIYTNIKGTCTSTVYFILLRRQRRVVCCVLQCIDHHRVSPLIV